MRRTTRLGLGVSALAALIAWLGRRPSAPGSTAAPDAPRYPHVERRGPNRAINVVRPAFGQRPVRADQSPAGDVAVPGDWEAF